jgi:hypothetical protein
VSDGDISLIKTHRLRVFEIRVLRKIYGPKREEVTGEWRRLHNEGPYDLCLPTIICLVKSRRMRWAGHQKTREVHTLIWWGDLKERRHFEDLGIDGRIILKWIISESIGRTWTGLIWLVTGKNDGQL